MSSSVSACIDLFYSIEGRNEFGNYYRLGSTDDLISAGLHLTDLNLFDGTSELLITGIHQEREIEDAIAKVSISYIIERELISLISSSNNFGS